MIYRVSYAVPFYGPVAADLAAKTARVASLVEHSYQACFGSRYRPHPGSALWATAFTRGSLSKRRQCFKQVTPMSVSRGSRGRWPARKESAACGPCVSLYTDPSLILRGRERNGVARETVPRRTWGTADCQSLFRYFGSCFWYVCMRKTVPCQTDDGSFLSGGRIRTMPHAFAPQARGTLLRTP
jgi:hypothetical protein